MHSDEKSQKRVEKLFSDLGQIATLREPLTAGESVPAEKPVLSVVETEPTPPVTNDSSMASSEMDTLLLRIRELEARLQESENRTASARANPAPAILYETKEVGYAYSGDNVLPIHLANTPALPAGKLENVHHGTINCKRRDDRRNEN